MRGGGVFGAAVAFAVGIVVGCLGLAPSLAGSADSRVAGLSTAVTQARDKCTDMLSCRYYHLLNIHYLVYQWCRSVIFIQSQSCNQTFAGDKSEISILSYFKFSF